MTKRELIEEYLNDHLDQGVEVAKEIFYYNGDLDWIDSIDFDELCELAAEGGADAVAELCRACVYGDTFGGMVRYNAYGNLEPAEEKDLESDVEDYMSDVLNALENIDYDISVRDPELQELLDMDEDDEEDEE